MRSVLLALLMVGCTASAQPSKQPSVEVVTVITLPTPIVKGELVEVLEVGGEPYEVRHTWMTGDEIEEVKRQRLIKEHPECDCQKGDPLCDCIWE